MSVYRLTVITQDSSALPQVKETIAQTEAMLVQEASNGERAFVYPIQKLTRGLYTTFLIDGQPQKIHGLDNATRTIEGVLRTLLVGWAMPKPPQPPARPESKVVKADEAKTAENEVIQEPISPKAHRSTRKVKDKVEGKKIAKVKPASDEDRLKALDEKLAEILKS